MRRVSFTAKALNLVLAPSTSGRKRPLEAWAKTVSEVVRSSGHSAEGEETFIEEFGFMLKCLADEPRLTPLGWTSAIAEAKPRLENRLRVKAIAAEHPAVLDERIERPVFVIGLPRTATSLAHRILAASDDHRGPYMWEMLHTDLETSPEVIGKRIDAAAKGIKLMMRVAPSWKVIHPSAVDIPEESMMVLPHGVYHLFLRGLMPEYREWLAARDTTPDYEYLKLALQILQHGREPKRWVLKYPGHLSDIETIRKVFPDATFVWTHRDPVTVIGSLCSLMETSWSTYQQRPDLHDIGRLAVELTSEAVRKGRESRVALPAGTIVDVPYALLNSDPHHEVPKIYEAIGATWTEKDAGNLDAVVTGPVTDRKHEYGVARYGLDLSGVEDAFGDYTRLVASLNR
ncbi:sulfotransferase family protein [Glycomyces paridis]|uniref:Sulfotransferase n=1 Tax=Glycomyces paridis TaxID=2126555 RepID=A0A4S8PHI6_9ACTN|nr:sulfotransferase [Glycomyces paridis]THV30088.1 sulfotransferase [Glycomyces paridis]